MSTQDINERWEQYKKSKSATARLNQAVKTGLLNRPTICELCEASPEPMTITTKYGHLSERPSIVGHHWKGYDAPLDVLWVCNQCNARMIGAEFHNGSMTREQSREYVLNFTRSGPGPNWAVKCTFGDCGNFSSPGEQFCYHHNPKDERPFCSGITLLGKPCKRKVSIPGRHCPMHTKQDKSIFD